MPCPPSEPEPEEQEEEEFEGDEADAGDGPRVGDVTVIPYPELRAQLGCGAEAGILVEDRRHVVKVFFPSMDRTFWLERDRVRAVAPERLPLHPIVERLNLVSRRVGAERIEEYGNSPTGPVFHVYCGALDVAGLTGLERDLGSSLAALRVEPGSVRRLRLSLTLRV
jgi:hypothetical protein